MNDTLRKLRIVVNGKSAGDPNLRTAVSTLRDRGHEVEVRVTWEFGDAARYAAETTESDTDVVVAAGGDGTINEVVQGILAAERNDSPAVAALPFGTANDFARGCGIPLGDPLAALELAAHGEFVPIDVGKANDSYFINVASGGFGAEVTVNTPKEMKKVLGGLAYTLMGILSAGKITPKHCRFFLPDGEEHSGMMLIMAVGNGRQCGGGQQTTPKALLDDGLLDLLVVHDVNLKTIGNALSEVNDLKDDNQYVSYKQVPHFRVESDQPIQINLDGEPQRSNSYQFQVIPKGVRFVLPPEAPRAG